MLGHLKYTTTQVVASEVPDEISLAIELSNCPIHCPCCHSKYLWSDTGLVLTQEVLEKLISNNKGITCVCFMGGDGNLDELYDLFKFLRDTHKDLKIAWYSGREYVPDNLPSIDYIKIGPYREECGPITERTTNQRMFQYNKYFSEISWPGEGWRDITYKFWKNGSDS